MAELFASLQAAFANRYSIERELGSGGMATVYLARDLKHDRAVAIKVLNPNVAGEIGAERFLREIRIAARLQHPHIVPLHDSGEADGFLYYVMPYIAGETLRLRLERERQLPLEDALRVAREVAEALDYAHRQGVVHRDIKPANILLADGQALVADFGIAHAITEAGGERLTATGLAVGTPIYMSPEQASGESQLDGRSDVYSLGCVLYEMLAGEPPHTGTSAQAVIAKRLSEPVPHLRTLREVPEVVEQAVTKALAKAPADRFSTAARFSMALATTRPRLLWRRTALRAAAVTLVVAGSAVLLLSRSQARIPLDPSLIAVAPFDVFDAKLQLWHEGLVDVLSRSLDGAGPLRTVTPTVVVRRWRGRADPAAAAELGRRTGAGLAVFGQLVASGSDSVRLSATLLDVTTTRELVDVELRDVGERMDRVADSLTVRLLRELGRTRPLAAVRVASLGSSSLPALKAFLQGEQYLRRTVWDSASIFYERAIALDSTFALAWRGASRARAWGEFAPDSIVPVLTTRAAALNRGLPPRESLFVLADSLLAALSVRDFGGDTAWSQQSRRLLETLNEGVRRYPNDPEAWFELSEARYALLFESAIGVTARQILEGYNRAIELDSSFAIAYLDPMQLALWLGDSAAARRYMRTYLALKPSGVTAAAIRMVAALLDADKNGSANTDQLIAKLVDTASADVLLWASSQLYGYPDSVESAVRLARHFLTAHRLTVPEIGDSSFLLRQLAATLAFRGHLAEAYRTGSRPARSFASWALLGGVPRDTARAVFSRELLQQQLLNSNVMFALPWWAVEGDVASLSTVAARAASIAQTTPHPWQKAPARYLANAARAYLTLVQHDTAAAILRFGALSDTACLVACPYERLTYATLLSARGQDREAAAILDEEYPASHSPMAVVWVLERARVNERLRNREAATSAYRFVADVWRNADPQLQPYVEEARAALKRFTGEPR